MTPFRPHPWTVGGHRQTFLGYVSRRRLRWQLPWEDLVVEAGEDVRLLLRASWQPGSREDRPALILVHGLGGFDAASYLLATGAHAWERSWHVLRMNLRGAGEAMAHCPRLYNAGLDGDLVAAVTAVARQVPSVAVAGFSLGGNLALLALGRSARLLPRALAAAAAVSPPIDLSSCADALERPHNRPYRWYFMGNLRRAYRVRQALRPDLYAPGRERGTRSIRAFDAAITAPYGGYRDVEHYYSASSAGPHLAAIDRPTLVLTALDDPLVPSASVARWPLPASGHVTRELTETGGHVGFVAPTRAPGRFWAAERVLDFLGAHTPGAAILKTS